MTYLENKIFQIREWVEFDRSGRATCPCCGKGHKDKTLSLVPNSEYAYKCFRGCTSAEIREVLGAPLSGQKPFIPSTRIKTTKIPPSKDYTVDRAFVEQASDRLLHDTSCDAQQARDWLASRGIGKEEIEHFHLGLGQRVITSNGNQPQQKETYGAICLFIPIPDRSDRYYVKKRVAPWLKDEKRPDYLGRWSQFGVPATIWFTHLPQDASQTWFCEGEWDAIRLAQLARQQQDKIAIATSTSGCGSVPKPEELERLPGEVIIFYDRNDKPLPNGTIPGEEGAKKLALALSNRSRIASVPMPEDCSIKGWDVSNAIDAGYNWSDFTAAAVAAIPLDETIIAAEKELPTSTPGAKRLLLDAEQLLQQVNNLINRDLPQSQLWATVPEIAQQTGYSERSVWQVYQHRISELEIEENRADTAVAIDAILKAKEASLDLHAILPNVLAEPLVKFANWLAIRPETILITLLTTVSALHHAETNSWLNRAWDFSVKPNLYSAIVAPPSQKKSPIVRAIARNPLKILEAKARLQWNEKVQQYKEIEQFYQSLNKEEKNENFPDGLPESPPDRRQVYAFTKYTSEGLRNQVKAYPQQGLLALPDELAGLLKSANVYRGGKGSDEEDLLTYYDGMGETVLRADGLAGDFDNLLLSLLSTIQPRVLQDFLKDGKDANGRWSRFLFVNQPLVPSMMNADGGSLDLTPMLADLYERVSQLPSMEYMPARDAFQYYCGVYNELERRRVVDPSPAMSAVWGKSEGRIGKIATNLHVIHELTAGRVPGQIIPKARYVEAVQITLFSIQQVFSLYNELAESDALATHLAKAIALSRKKKGWISARDLQLGYDSKSRPTANQVRSWFRELEAMGKGVLQGENCYLKFNALSVGKPSTNSPTEISLDLSSFKPNVEFVGECGVFLNKVKERNYEVNGSDRAVATILADSRTDARHDFSSNGDRVVSTTPTNSTNAHKTDSVRDLIVGEDSTKLPTAPTNGNKPHSDEDVVVEEDSTIEDLKALLLACQTIADLLEARAEYSQEMIQQAYSELNSYERKQIRYLILQAEQPILVMDKVISSVEFLSEFVGVSTQDIQIGSRVKWIECPSHLEQFSPFEVLEIHPDGWVSLDLVNEFVPICELRV